MSPSYLDAYEPVEDRLREFKEAWPESRVTTKLVTPEAKAPGDVIIFRCKLFRLPPVQTITVQGSTAFPDATGYAHQRILKEPPPKRDGNPNTDSPEWTSPWEVAETSAIGRALANLGYAPKGGRPSREEVSKAQVASGGEGGHGDSPTPSEPATEGVGPEETIAYGEGVTAPDESAPSVESTSLLAHHHGAWSVTWEGKPVVDGMAVCMNPLPNGKTCGTAEWLRRIAEEDRPVEVTV